MTEEPLITQPKKMKKKRKKTVDQNQDKVGVSVDTLAEKSDIDEHISLTQLLSPRSKKKKLKKLRLAAESQLCTKQPSDVVDLTQTQESSPESIVVLCEDDDSVNSQIQVAKEKRKKKKRKHSKISKKVDNNDIELLDNATPEIVTEAAEMKPSKKRKKKKRKHDESDTTELVTHNSQNIVNLKPVENSPEPESLEAERVLSPSTACTSSITGTGTDPTLSSHVEAEKKRKKRKKKHKLAPESKISATTAETDEANNLKEADLTNSSAISAVNSVSIQNTSIGTKLQKTEPFRRVKDVVPTDKISNSFLSKPGSADSWGVKAYNDFRSLSGKAFRREKTKKKRGSYLGGKIDTGVHSFKFADSDDD